MDGIKRQKEVSVELDNSLYESTDEKVPETLLIMTHTHDLASTSSADEFPDWRLLNLYFYFIFSFGYQRRQTCVLKIKRLSPGQSLVPPLLSTVNN